MEVVVEVEGGGGGGGLGVVVCCDGKGRIRRKRCEASYVQKRRVNIGGSKNCIYICIYNI